MAKNTIAKLFKQKQSGDKITAITAYDASFSHLFAECGIDLMLVGDSLGMVLQGHDSTVPVSVADIAYHTRAVRNGAKDAFVVADMPFMSYSTSTEACHNAAELMRAGANMVKLEGGEWLIDTVKALHTRGIPVCAHLGLLPQSVNVIGGYKVQGREQHQADALIKQARQLEQAGAQLLVVECIPNALGKAVSEAVNMPVIGIGAGADTDGQILVMHDMLGLTANYLPKFAKNYLQQSGDVRSAIQSYIEEVKSGTFPDAEHSFG